MLFKFIFDLIRDKTLYGGDIQHPKQVSIHKLLIFNSLQTIKIQCVSNKQTI